MDSKEKNELSESDISDLFITPAIRDAGWDFMRQIRREVTLTPVPFIVRGNLSSRNKKKKKFADYVFYWEPNVPVAVIEAKVCNKRWVMPKFWKCPVHLARMATLLHLIIKCELMMRLSKLSFCLLAFRHRQNYGNVTKSIATLKTMPKHLLFNLIRPQA
jgi:hypothetical protein